MDARRLTIALAFSLALTGLGVSTLPALAADTAKPKPPAASAPAPASGPVYREFTEGNPKAKVTVIEYASLTCPHCAHFAQESYPQLKKDYIDAGKIKYVYRDYPLDGLALGAALIARCAPTNQGIPFIESLFVNQLTWVQATDALVPLKDMAKKFGMTDADVDACLKNEGILESIKDVAETGSKTYMIEATPTFLVGDQKVEGDDYDKLKDAMDKALAKNTK